MRRLIVVVGPQGSGNKLFSKLFAMNPATQGWQQLLESDTELDHDHEPFYAAWNNPVLLGEYPWHNSKIHIANMSCPFMANDVPVIPDIVDFVNTAKKYALVSIVVITRDQNIIAIQNSKLGRENSAYVLMQQLEQIENNFTFVSQESVYLYKHLYWHSIERQLGLPLTDPAHINAELIIDRNEKYINSAQSLYEKFRGDSWPAYNNITTAPIHVQKEILEMFAKYYNVTSSVFNK